MSKENDFGVVFKICTSCRKIKPLSSYRKYSGRSRYGCRPICKVCQRAYEKRWRAGNKNSLVESRKRRRSSDKVYRKKYIERNRALYLVSRIQGRCKKYKLPFDLMEHLDEIQDRIDSGICEISGIKLRKEHGKQSFNSPSIDRIVPSEGYIYSNIRIVCWAINAAFGTWGEEITREVMTSWLMQ